jgi:hypothetical protein
MYRLAVALLAAPLAAEAQHAVVERSSTVELTARYVGTISGSAYGTGFEARITASLIQVRDLIVGTWAIFQPVFRQGTWTALAESSGTVTGGVSGLSMTFEARQGDPCPGVLRGQAAIREDGAGWRARMRAPLAEVRFLRASTWSVSWRPEKPPEERAPCAEH